MPQIIIPGPQVDATGLQLPGAPTLGDEGLGTVAQGTGVAAEQMRAQQTELDTKRNATRVFEAESRLADMEREMRTTNQARRGSDAYGVTDTVAGWWESEPSKISAELENETQKTLFAEAVSRRREISLNAFSTHEANESNTAVNDATEARKVNAINYGAANYDDPTAVAQARQDLIDSVVVQGRFNGLSKDQREALQVDALTKLHTNVIENMMDTDPAAAAAYFTAHKDEIAGSTHDAINTKLTASKDVVAAQQLADNVWSRGLSEQQALAAVRKEAEGPTREHALSLLRQQFNDQEQAVDRVNRARLEATRNTVAEGGVRALSPGDVTFLQQHYPQELRAMHSSTPQDQVATDWDAYELLLDHARANPANFRDSAKTDLMLYRGVLNTIELDKLMKLQKDMQDNVPSSVMTVEQMISSHVKDVDADYAEDFRRDAWKSIEDEQKRLGRKLSGDEMQAQVDKQLMEIRVPDGGWFWFDAKKPRYSVTPEETVAAYNAIPEAMRIEAEADLKTSGREPSQSNVVALYNMYLDRGND